MAFPCLMYLTSVGTCPSPPQAGGSTLTNTATNVVLGIVHIYQDSGRAYYTVTGTNVTTSYYSISLSLNILLTLMIVVRLVVHTRNVRKATGVSDGSHGLHTTAATVAMMLIESYALYAVALMAYTVSWAVQDTVVNIFSGILGSIQVRVIPTFADVLLALSNHGCTQVIAPYLIILRVAKRRALTSESISGTAGSIRFRTQGSTSGDRTLSDREPPSPTEVNGEAAGELVTCGGHTIEEVPL